MDRDNGFTTKLWLEEYEACTTTSQLETTGYSIKKFSFKKNQLVEIEKFIKKNNISWEVILHAAWGLLLNRFSSSDCMTYGTSTLLSAKNGLLKIQYPLSIIKSVLTEKQSIESFIKKTHLALTKKNKTNSKEFDEIRYLFLFTHTKKQSKKNSLIVNQYQFPLIFIAPNKKSEKVSVFYNTSLFSDNSIESIFLHFSLILKEMCKNKSKKIVSLNLLTPNESKNILQNWRKPTYPFKTPPLSCCMQDLFENIAKQFPDNLAISYHDLEITYQELNIAVSDLANQLLEREVSEGDIICVLMDRTPTLIMAMLAIFKCGAVYVPINPKYPEERIEYILSDCQAKYILTNDLNRLSLTHRHRAFVITADWQFFTDNLPDNPLFKKIDPEQIAYIIYTSGTTGKPKGVMIRHKSLTNLIGWYIGCFQITEKERACQFASQAFDTFLCEVVPYLATGGSVHIIDDNTKLTPSLFFEWMVKQQITIADLPTAYAQMLFTMNWPKKLALKTLKIGGESVTHYPTQLFQFDIWNGYGPTETTIEATYNKIYEANTDPHSIRKHLPPPIGKPITGIEAYVVDKYLQPVPIGICGELLLGGISVSTGYLNRPELTQEKFIPSILAPKSNEKLYRTGDLVRWLPDGQLEFVGRIDHQVKIRGYRIELGDIENAISQHADVNEVVVLAKEKLNGEKSIVAYIVPNLDKARYLYQERCLLSLNNNKFIEATTEDISKEGVALSGISEPITLGHLIQLHLKLPGFTDGKLLAGHIIWSQNNRLGIAFDLNDEERNVISKSIDYYLSTNNVMELVLSASAKRSLRKALRNKLPEYMIPSVFVSLLQFPLTFSGKIDVKALPPPQHYEQILQKEYVKPKTETEKKLAAIWSKLLHKPDISMTDNFFDIGGSSLTAAELSVNIFHQFNISIPTKILFDLPYIPVAAEYIDTNGKKYATNTVIQAEIERDCILHENITPTKKLSQHLHDPKHILLTGAGGFLGIYMLRELLKKTNAKIYCLIRKGEFESAAKRLLATVHKFNLEKDISLNNRRIVIIASDISFDHFGLPLEQYNHLVNTVELIYHCGAQVSIMAAYHKLRGSNVQGTLEIIKFATHGQDKPIHYISTLSAATKKDLSGNFEESFPSENYNDLFGGYAISKWVSERLLAEVNRRSLPIAIYRSGYISGQSDTGITNLNDALLMLIKGCIQLELAPDMNEKITILPVDFVSQATAALSLALGNQSGIFHLDHPTGILWKDLIAWLNDYGYSVKIIPMKEWQDKLIKISYENALFPFLPYYLALDPKEKIPDVNTDVTASKLNQLGISYPAIDDKLLNIYFDHLCQINFLPFPNKIRESEKT